METIHFTAELWKQILCRWYLTGPLRKTGLAVLHPMLPLSPQLPLAEVQTASVSMPHRGLVTSVIAPRDTQAIPMSPVTRDA
jgi:hypothetical protein